MGEAQDKLSQSSISDLSRKINDAKAQNASGQNETALSKLKKALNAIPSSKTSEQAKKADELNNNAVNFDPSQFTTAQVQQQLWEALVWRDGIMREIERVIENVPGLQNLVDQLTEAITVCELGFGYGLR